MSKPNPQSRDNLFRKVTRHKAGKTSGRPHRKHRGLPQRPPSIRQQLISSGHLRL